MRLLGRKGKGKDRLDAEILEDVDLSAIVEQKRRQQQEAPQEAKQEARQEAEEKAEIAEAYTPDLDDALQERFFEWLVEQAVKNDRDYKLLLEAIDRVSINKLRMLCRTLLKKLRERS